MLLSERPELPLVFMSNLGFSTLILIGLKVGVILLVFLKYSKGIILKLDFFFDLSVLMILAA